MFGFGKSKPQPPPKKKEDTDDFMAQFGGDIHIDESELDDPELLRELEQFHMPDADQDDVHVDVTEDDLKDEHLLRELHQLTGVETHDTPQVTNPVQEQPVQGNLIQIEVEQDESVQEQSEELPVEVKLKSKDAQLMAKYVQLEKVKAAQFNRAGDKDNARKSYLAFKALDARLNELKATPAPQQPVQRKLSQAPVEDLLDDPHENDPSVMKLLDKRASQYKLAALEYKKLKNLSKAKEMLDKMKGIQSLIEGAQFGKVVDPNAIPPEPIVEQPKVVKVEVKPEVPTKEESPQVVIQKLIAQCQEQITQCTDIAAQFYKLGDKQQALVFHKYKKTFTADLATLQALGQQSVIHLPVFTFRDVSYQIENIFADLSMQDIQVGIARAISLTSDQVQSSDLETWVSFDLGLEDANQAKGDTDVVKKTHNPQYNFKKTVKIERNKAFKRYLERKKATFEVFHNRGFLRKPISLGSKSIPLTDLITHSEISEVLQLNDSNSRRLNGAKLEVYIRLRQPLVGQDFVKHNERWLFFGDNGLQQSPSVSSQISPSIVSPLNNTSPVLRSGSKSELGPPKSVPSSRKSSNSGRRKQGFGRN